MTVTVGEEYAALQQQAARYLDLPAVRRGYKRDDIGRFSSGGGFGASHAGDGEDGPDVGEHGFGRDPHGVSYTELDVDSHGAPRFSPAYRDRYGRVESETRLGSSSTSLVTTERGIHVADDARGTRDREVVQEFTPRQAASLGDDVYQVNSEGGTVTNRPTGVTVAASGGPARDGSYPARVTFRNGTSVDLSADDAFEFQEALTIASGETRSAARARLHRYMTLLDLPVPDADLEVRRGYKRDDQGRFSSGGGGGGAGGGSGGGGASGTPEQMHDEAVIRATYTFTDPVTGMRAEVTRISNAGPGQPTYVGIKIRDRAGRHVGDAEREIYPPDQKEVHHGGIALRPEVQGQGFATRYNEQVEQVYREHGIERVSLFANIDVGGYSWARAGYDFQDQFSRYHVGQRAMQMSQQYGPDVQRQATLLASRPDTTPLEFSMIGYTPGAETWPGREIMLGSSWSGVKEL